MIHTLSPAEEEDLQTAPLTPPMGWSRFVQVYTVQVGNYWSPTKAQNIQAWVDTEAGIPWSQMVPGALCVLEDRYGARTVCR